MVVEIPLSKTGKNKGRHIAIIDDCDSDLSQLNWHIKTNTDYQLYAIRKPNSENSFRWMHRLILERVLERPLTRDELVDHINGNTLDNRRANLRVATQSQNQANRGKQANNKSGYKGVFWNKQCNKWKAQIKFKRAVLYLGHFDDPKAAHEAYCAKAKELYGEFAKLE